MNKSSPIEDLFVLHLADGLPGDREGRQIRYKTVRLREISVADERTATRMAERVVMVAGAPQLLASTSDQQYALTMLHIQRFECDGMFVAYGEIDLDVFGRLSTHDLGLIEARVFLLNMAAKVRYGLIDADEFARFMRSGEADKAEPSAPQPVGQAPDVGAQAHHAEPGPSMLTDFTAGGANVATTGVDG